MTDPLITICVQCHNFQRRLCWMLSSLIGQPVVVHVAHFRDNGEPPTFEVIHCFRNAGLKILDRSYADMDRFERRGLTRTDQLGDVATPWVLWADTDMVYYPTFFDDLNRELEDYADYDGMLIAGRWSQPNNRVRFTRRLVEGEQTYFIHHAWGKADGLRKVRRANVGAGYFQLIRTTACGGRYVSERECRDWRWSGRGQKARSDIAFRRRIGDTTKLPRWFSEHQIHLNHRRDSDTGTHLEVQR